MEAKTEAVMSFEEAIQQNDLKQHADKIIQGIKAIESSHARRAIWELFQNAVDLSDQCEIWIGLNDHELVFSHNGHPFTPLTLDCLITQVSSKTLTESKIEREEDDQTGQYGTGFMTTHAFSDVVWVSGTIRGDARRDHHVGFSELKIDRSTQDWEQMCRGIAKSREQVREMLQGESICGELPKTSFRYSFESDLNKSRAVNAIHSLETILPCVMVFNERLKTVVVKDATGNTTCYTKEAEEHNNESYFSRRIYINDIERSVNYLRIDDAIVILPLQAASEGNDGSLFIAEPCSDALPQLFLFYPLIGTDRFGFNFVVHSKNFHPTESRDGLHLQSDNPKNKVEEQVNREIMDKASEAIFEFLRANLSNIENPHLLSEINFAAPQENTELAQYLAALKGKWTSEFMALPLVDTSQGRISPQEAVFFEPSVIDDIDDPTRRAIYNIANRYYPNLPSIGIASQWSEIVGKWESDGTTYIYFSDIADKIEDEGSINTLDTSELMLLYKAMISKGGKDIFMDKALLPNINRQFKKQNELKRAINLPDELTPLADALNSEISDCRIDPDFILDGLEFIDFNRRDFREKINASLHDHSVDKKRLCDLPQDYVAALVAYSCIATREDSMSAPIQIIKKIAVLEGIEFEPIVIPPLPNENDFDVRAGQISFFKAYLNEISDRSEGWVRENIDTFSVILKDAFHKYQDFKESMVSHTVFPDQMCKLKSIDKLSRYDEISEFEFIKDMYDDVVRPELPVRETLAHGSIADIPQSSKNALDLARDIEQRFFGDLGKEISLENHDFKEHIMKVIQKIINDEDTYAKIFHKTFDNRANIMVQVVSGNDAFIILSQDKQTIERLAGIANRPDLDELLRLGQEAIEKRRQDNASFQWKKQLGNHLEYVLNRYLSLNVNATVSDVQDGQDLVFYVENQPVYYIEVKSKWKEETPFRMSRNQTLQAHSNPDCYALCTIDMTQYTGADKYEVKSIESIEHCMKFNTDVGTRVEHLVANYKDTEIHADDRFRLDGDYRTYIPYWYIKGGINLRAFEEYLQSQIGINKG